MRRIGIAVLILAVAAGFMPLSDEFWLRYEALILFADGAALASGAWMCLWPRRQRRDAHGRFAADA